MGELPRNPDEPAFDPILAWMCRSSLEAPLPFRVTLAVDGHLVSGMLATWKDYLAGMEQSFAANGRAYDLHFMRTFQELHAMTTEESQQASLDDDDDDHAHAASFICLNDVAIEGAFGVRRVLWWSVRVSAISGWWLASDTSDPVALEEAPDIQL